MHGKLSLFALAAPVLVVANFSPALAATYYEEQTYFTESSVPMARYSWYQDDIEGCIYK
jgi:hypothetical protein